MFSFAGLLDNLEILKAWEDRHAQHLGKLFLPDLLRLSGDAGKEVGRELSTVFQQRPDHFDPAPRRKVTRSVISLLIRAMGAREKFKRAVLAGQLDQLIQGVTRPRRQRALGSIASVAGATWMLD